MSFGKVLGTFSKKGGSKAAVVADDDSATSVTSTARRLPDQFDDDQLTRRSVMVDDDMDMEAFGKLINQGQSMRFQFAEDDEDEDDRYEYNAEISVFPPKLEDAVHVCKERAKEWSTATGKFLSFLERRMQMELETYRQLSKFTRENLEFFSKEGFKGDGSYYRGIMDIMRTQELMSLKAQDFLTAVNKRVLDPLNNLRKDHDKSRKRLWTHYEGSQKKVADAVALLEKSKAKYQKQATAWEKTIQEKLKEQSSNYKVKLDKKNKEEEEAHQQTDFLEQQYRENLRAANKSLEEHKKGTQLIISAFERLLRNSDDKLKEFLAIHAELEEECTKSLLPQAAESRQKLAMIDDLHFLQQFIAKVSSGKTWWPAPYVFEKHHVDGEAGQNVNAETPKGLHNFKKVTHGFKCRQCDMYSFVGMECVECGLHCHRKCVEKLKGVCSGPSSKADRVEKKPCVFGFPLASQPLEPTTGLPYVVFKCIEEVEKRGMNEEGIYRVGGMKLSVDTVCGLFEERGDSDHPVDLSIEPDINAITGCLKSFFRKLPEPLVPYQLYAPMIAMATQTHPSSAAFAGLLGDFPTKNFEVLRVLIEHLRRVSQNSEVNKMRASNLGIIFGPSLLRSQASETDPLVALSDNSIQSKVIETLILGYDEIFQGALALREKRRSVLGSMASIEGHLDKMASEESVAASTSQPESAIEENKGEDPETETVASGDFSLDASVETPAEGEADPQEAVESEEGKTKRRSKAKSGKKDKERGHGGSPAKEEESTPQSGDSPAVATNTLEAEPQPVHAPEEGEKEPSPKPEPEVTEASSPAGSHQENPQDASTSEDHNSSNTTTTPTSIVNSISSMSSIDVSLLNPVERPAPYAGRRLLLPGNTSPTHFSLISEVPSYSGMVQHDENDVAAPARDTPVVENDDDKTEELPDDLLLQAQELVKGSEAKAAQLLTQKIQNLLDDEE